MHEFIPPSVIRWGFFVYLRNMGQTRATDKTTRAATLASSAAWDDGKNAEAMTPIKRTRKHIATVAANRLSWPVVCGLSADMASILADNVSIWRCVASWTETNGSTSFLSLTPTVTLRCQMTFKVSVAAREERAVIAVVS